MHTHKQQTGSGSNGASSSGNLGAGLDSHTDMAAASLCFVVEGTAPVCQKTRPIPPDCTRAYARVYHPTEETKGEDLSGNNNDECSRLLSPFSIKSLLKDAAGLGDGVDNELMEEILESLLLGDEEE